MAHFSFLFLLLFSVYTGPCPRVTSPISQVLVPVLELPPLYHKYWSLSNSYLHYITSSGPCPRVTSTISQVMVPVLELPPLYYKSTGPCPTVDSPISHVLVPVLQLPPIYHMHWSLPNSYFHYITSSVQY